MASRTVIRYLSKGKPQGNHKGWRTGHGMVQERAALKAMQGMYVPTESKVSVCIGCGGSSSNMLLCARCHRIKHYGEMSLPGKTQFELSSYARLVKDRPGLIVLVVDATDPESTLFCSPIQEMCKCREVMVIVTKADVLPAELGDIQRAKHRVERWIRQRMAKASLPKPIVVHVVSGATGFGVGPLEQDLRNQMHVYHQAFVVGAANVGKSTLINSISQRAERAASHHAVFSTSQRLTTSALAGTTLGLIRVPIRGWNGGRLYDTPGIVPDFSLLSHLSAEEATTTTLTKRVHGRMNAVDPGGSLLLGGMLRMDVHQGQLLTTSWVAHDVHVHARKTIDIENFIERHQGGLLRPSGPPLGDGRTVRIPCTTHKEACADIAVPGLGWMTLMSMPLHSPIEIDLSFYVPEDVGVFVRESLVRWPKMATRRLGLEQYAKRKVWKARKR